MTLFCEVTMVEEKIVALRIPRSIELEQNQTIRVSKLFEIMDENGYEFVTTIQVSTDGSLESYNPRSHVNTLVFKSDN